MVPPSPSLGYPGNSGGSGELSLIHELWDEPPCPSRPPACRTAEAANVLFLVGHLESEGKESSRLLQDFIRNVARSFENTEMGRGGVQLGLALYGDTARWVWLCVGTPQGGSGFVWGRTKVGTPQGGSGHPPPAILESSLWMKSICNFGKPLSRR